MDFVFSFGFICIFCSKQQFRLLKRNDTGLFGELPFKNTRFYKAPVPPKEERGLFFLPAHQEAANLALVPGSLPLPLSPAGLRPNTGAHLHLAMIRGVSLPRNPTHVYQYQHLSLDKNKTTTTQSTPKGRPTPPPSVTPHDPGLLPASSLLPCPFVPLRGPRWLPLSSPVSSTPHTSGKRSYHKFFFY